MANADRLLDVDAGLQPPSFVDQAEVDLLMRHLLQPDHQEEAEVLPIAQGAVPRRDFEMASELLERASQAFDLLIGRCQRLEGDLKDAAERAQAQIAEQESVIEQWKRLASGFKGQLDASEQAAAALKARSDAAEARAAMAEQRATALERASAQVAAHAATADQLSTKLHDKVVSAFGIGSRAHPVLEAVATRTAAK